MEALKNYDVWMEGYRATGNYEKAMFLGRHPGTSFKEACKVAVKICFKTEKRDLYDENNNTYWGCGLYDNEQEARKSYG